MPLRTYALVLLLLCSCSFKDEIPPGVVTRCAEDRDCPTGQQCEPALRRCVRVATGVLDGFSLEPKLGRAGTVFLARLQPGPNFSGEATLSLWTADGAPVARFTADPDDALAFRWTATGTEPEGPLAVLLDARSTSGTVTGLRAGSLSLDFTAPQATRADLQLIPASDNALANLGFASSLAAVREGTSIEVTLSASEPLAGLPEGRVLCAGVALSGFTLAASGTADRPLLRGALVGMPEREGDCEVQVDLSDLVGNRATRALDFPKPLRVDVTAPPAPSVALERQVLFVRAPRGEAPDAGPAFRVELAQPPAEPAVLVVGNPEGVVLARALSVDNAPPVARLEVSTDPVDVDVQWVDLAGNRSPRVRVQDHDFIALLAPQLRSGGYALSSRPVWALPAGLEDVVDLTPSPVGLIASLRDGGLAELDGDENFTAPLLVELGRPSRRGAAVTQAFVSGSYGALYFGGLSSDGVPLRETLRRDGALASTVTVQPSGPPARVDAVLANLINRAVLFGGRGADGQLLDDTWLLETDGGWSPFDAGAVRPPARERAGASQTNYQSTVYLAGGRGRDGGLLGDVWQFGPQAPLGPLGWSQVPLAVPPRERPSVMSTGLGLALFGGQLADGGLSGELFMLDGGVQLLTTAPQGRAGASCAANFLFTVALTCNAGLGAQQPDGGMTALSWRPAGDVWSLTASLRGYFYGGHTATSSAAMPEGILFSGMRYECDGPCDGPGTYRWDGRSLRRVAEQVGGSEVLPTLVAATPRGPEWFDGRGTSPYAPVLKRWTPWGTITVSPLPQAVDTDRYLGGLAFDSTHGLYVYGGGKRTVYPFTFAPSTFIADAGSALTAGPPLPDAGFSLALDRPDLGGAVFYGDGVAARFDGAAWVLSPGPPKPACGAADPLRHELYTSTGDPQTTLTRSDGGTELIPGLSCPLAFDPLRPTVTSLAGKSLTELDVRGARPKLALTFDALAGRPTDAGVQRVTLELLGGGDGIASGQSVVGARVAVVGGPQGTLQGSVASPAPLQLVFSAPADDGGFRARGAFTLEAESVGVNGAGEATVVLSGKSTTWLKH